MPVPRIAFVVGVMLVAANLGSQLAVGASAQESRLIAFQTDRDGNHEIYVMNEDGSEPRNLTKNPANDMVPKWSPDGEQITFASNRDGNWGIYVMDADGGRPRRLTSWKLSEFAPAWSPVGNRIAFTSNIDGDWEIYIVSATGKGEPLNVSNSHDVEDLNPDWSPTGKQLVFQSGVFGEEGFALSIVDVGQGKPRRLPRKMEDEVRPAWSPVDRGKIAYVGLLKENYGIYTTDPAGKVRRRLIDLSRSEESDPAWSPEGKAIAFTRDNGQSYDIYTLTLGGSPRNLTRTPDSHDVHPAWQPQPTQRVSSLHQARPQGTRVSKSVAACGSGHIQGTVGNNFGLCGSNGDDWIEGLAGDDKLKGYKGNDKLEGDKYRDSTAGRDWLWGYEGDDAIWAGDGKADCTVNGGSHINGDSARIDFGLDPVSYIEAYF
jgi:Tol biopolymer transport system component